MRSSDAVGQKFGRLLVLALAERKNGLARAHCRCDCGVERIFYVGNLRHGHSKSCGCVLKKIMADIQRTHGLAGTTEYRIWTGIKTRCYNPNTRAYPRYGGRGIVLCDRWMAFENFLADMGPRPSAKHSIDRIDGNGNYEPGNCRWATTVEQSRNRLSTRATLDIARKIRVAHSAGVSQVELAQIHGVGTGTVSQIVNNRQWKEAP